MTHWKRNLALLWVSQLFVMVGFASTMPFIPLFISDHLGISEPGPRGAVVAAFSFAATLGYGIFNPVWGALSDRVGVKPMLLRGTFLAGLVFPLMAWASSSWELVAIRFVSAALAGTTAASQILVVKGTPEERQGFALGFLGTAFWAGTMLGNVLGGYAVVHYGYKVAFFVCTAGYLLGGVAVLFCREDRARPDPAARIRRTTARGAFTRPVLAVMALILAYSFVRYFELPYVAMRVEEIVGHDEAAHWTALANAFIAVGAFASGFLVGRLADRFRPVSLLLPALAFTGAMLLVQALSGDIVAFCASRTALYLVGGGLGAVLQKMLSRLTPPEDRGTVFGVQSTAHAIGIMLSTAASGALIYRLGASPATADWGVRGMFLAAAALSFLFLPACWAMVRGSAPRHARAKTI